jgi:hypothetical protein
MYFMNLERIKFLNVIRHMHPKILKGFSLGLSFHSFEYLSFEFEYFANLLQISKETI